MHVFRSIPLNSPPRAAEKQPQPQDIPGLMENVGLLNDGHMTVTCPIELWSSHHLSLRVTLVFLR